MIASVHGSGLEEIRERPGIRELIGRNYFERYIVLGREEKPGVIKGIYDEQGMVLCGK